MIVLTDVETTGLRPEDGHQLLEIFVQVHHPVYPFDQVGESFHRVIHHHPDDAIALADDYVHDMHDKTGLWDKVAQGHPLHLVDTALLDFLQHHVPKRVGRVTGNSVRLDMNFMDAYLPKAMSWLHYRFLDVTGLSWFANENFNIPFYEKDTANTHSAQHDVMECLRELRHVTAQMSKVENILPTQLRNWVQAQTDGGRSDYSA